MTNAHGTPIWYERLAKDADAMRTFYQDVIGWTVHDAEPGGMDYRMIDTGTGDFVGGMMQLTPALIEGGAAPCWLFYIGVNDVDATVAAMTAQGGSVRMPATDMEGVGRMALVADPQGNPFYVMRGASAEMSRAWQRAGMGKCAWHELLTHDQAAGNAFYAETLGWHYPHSMPMPGDMGEYIFVEAGGETIGGTMKASGAHPAGWRFYFRAPDVEAAARAVEAGGGAVLQPPQPVPGGDLAMLARDLEGVVFGIVASPSGE